MEVRQISNKKNIVALCLGAVLLVISIIKLWSSQNFDLLFVLLGIIGICMIFISIFNIAMNSETNKDLKNLAYRIDYQKEFSTYKIIGRDKGKAKNGALRFHKYSEWKEYIEKTFKTIIDDEDAYRFMIRRLRNTENRKEVMISIVVPVEVAILTILYSSRSTDIDISKLSELLPILFLISIIIAFLGIEYSEYKEEISFILDFNEIVFPSKYNSYHQ